jgi:DNA invertase Pin-like site-specific DNA recombinase
MRTVIYWRTSPLEAENDARLALTTGQSILAQEEMVLLNWCLERGRASAERVVDAGLALSLRFAQREGGAVLLNTLRAGDLLLVHALERLFSSCYDAASILQQLRERGVALYVFTLGADVCAPDYVLDVVTAARVFALLERRRAVERVRSVKSTQRSKGRYLGGSRPFGYMIHSNGRLIENPMEQKVLKRILQLRERGCSLRAIAEAVSTPVAPISFKTVQRILQRHV